LARRQNKIADQQKPPKFLIAVAANFSTIGGEYKSSPDIDSP